MNSISEQLLQAMDIIVDGKISKLEFDKTIQATIYKVENIDTGEYKVKYNGNIFSAYATDLQQTYKLEDLVYVIVPQGNFSNKKLITDLVSSKSLSANQLMALQNSIFEISPSFNILYGQDYDPEKLYGVIAGTTPGATGSYDYIFQGSEIYQQNSYHGLFQQYSAQYDLIRIKAYFMTQFFDEHDRGNYGIEVQFYAKSMDGYEIVSYTLDLNDFNGDPYHYSVFSPQWVIIKTQKNYLLGLKSIKLFEKEFEYDSIYENGIATDKKNTTVANIFVKDISLQFVEQKDLSDTNYYLMIAAPKGIAFTENISSLELMGRVIHEGKDVMDETTCKCQWYVRDLSVMIGNEEYDKNAGFGWRKLDKQTGKSLSLVASDINYQQKYKLSVIYNETIVLAAEIELYNNNAIYDYRIDQVTEGEDIKLLITNNLQNGLLVGDWYLSYPDGTYLQLDNGKKKNSVTINQYLKYSSVIFYCAIYNYAKTQIVGTLEYTVVSSESKDDISISYIGMDTFRYDANGDIDMDLAEQEKTIQAILAWKEGVGTAYTSTWIMYDDKGREIELTGSTYKPPLSMIEEVLVDNGNILHYNIRKKYISNFNNNILTIKIKTINGEEYRFNKEVIFLKDGDQGTNGLTYVIVIRPCNAGGLKLSGFQPLIYNNGWKNTLPLRCYVYKDGEFINNNSKYTINYKWTGINVSFTEEEANRIDRVTARGVPNLGSSSVTVNSGNLQFYVKVQVDINDHTNGRKISVYASYPIDVAVGGIEVDKVNISTIPLYIKYTPSGINPTFYSNDINFVYREATLNSGIKSLNTSILDIEEREGLKYLKPASSFIFENIRSNLESNVGVLKLSYTNTQYILHSIIMYLDNYSNEAINGWDGTKLETGGLNEDGEPTAIFAPQIGAGEKDSYNRFTGVVMGKDSSQDYIGLYGYQAGMNTFGLREDGRAYFGAKAGGGQIVIDGRYAAITGGDVELNSGKPKAAANGMYIVLADKNNGPNSDYNVKSDTKAIGIGLSTHKDALGNNVTEENFYVTFDGKMKATGADIQGTIYAAKGQIGGTEREGGWTIETNLLKSGTQTNTVGLSSNPNTEVAIWAGKTEPGTGYEDGTIKSPAPFVVTRNGYVYANNVKIKGNVEADTLVANKQGTIGGWTITSNKLYNNNGTISVGLSSKSSDKNVFWVGDTNIDENTSEADLMKVDGTSVKTKFAVTRQGKMIATGAEIRGSLYADNGTIGNWSIDENGLIWKNPDDPTNRNKMLWFTPDKGLKINNTFSVTADGTLTATKGKIGGWTVEENRLVGRDVSGGSSVIIGLDSSQPKKLTTDSSFSPTVDGPSYFAIWAGRNSPGSEYNPNAATLKQRIPGGASFVVTKDGFVKMTNAYIKGELEADEGQIGYWKLMKGVLISTNSDGTINGKAGMSSRGTYRFWSNADGVGNDGNPTSFPDSGSYFWVDSNGKLSCRHAIVNGKIEADSGRIGELKITTAGLKWGNNYIYNEGSKISIGSGTNRRDIYDSFVTHDTDIDDLRKKVSDLGQSIASTNSKFTNYLLKDNFSAYNIVSKINSGSYVISKNKVEHPSFPTSLPAVFG